MIIIFAAALAVAGCTTAADREGEIDRRFDSFVGMSVAQFIAETGIAPHDFYDTAGGRTFMAAGPIASVYLPPMMGAPGVVAHHQCVIQLHARRVDEARTADSWRITGTTRRGACANV